MVKAKVLIGYGYDPIQWYLRCSDCEQHYPVTLKKSAYPPTKKKKVAIMPYADYLKLKRAKGDSK